MTHSSLAGQSGLSWNTLVPMAAESCTQNAFIHLSCPFLVMSFTNFSEMFLECTEASSVPKLLFRNDYTFSNNLKNKLSKIPVFSLWLKREKNVNQSHKEKKYILIKTLSSAVDAYGFWLCPYQYKDGSNTCSIRAYFKAILCHSKKEYMV